MIRQWMQFYKKFEEAVPRPHSTVYSLKKNSKLSNTLRTIRYLGESLIPSLTSDPIAYNQLVDDNIRLVGQGAIG